MAVTRTGRARRGDEPRLRVAIVAESFLPSVNGVSNSVVRLIEYLRGEGHAVLVIAPQPGDDEVLGVPVVRVPSVGLPGYPDVRVGCAASRVVSTLRAFRPDVVHLAAPMVLGAVGALAARSLGIPTVAIFQTDVPGFARRYGLSVAVPAAWWWLRWIHRSVDLTLAPSTTTAWTLSTRGVPRVGRWARGVDTEQFSPVNRCEALHERLAPEGEVVVGFVGRLAREKQLERLVSVSRRPEVRVVIVGDGPERERLERLMPRAIFTGMLRGEELGRHVATFDVFVHPGLDETFCQAVQEALAAGVPVVAPAAGGPLDLVVHGRNGFLWSPEQPETLEGAVLHLATAPLLRRAMGASARQSVDGRTWSQVMAELIGHYESILVRDRPVRGIAA